MKADFLTKETILNYGTKDKSYPKLEIGDTVEVNQIVKEGDKERIQKFKGDIIAIHNKGVASTFTIRKIGADSIGVERIYPYYSPMISNVNVIKKGDIRRAKLYYVRDRIGKAARIKEKVLTKEQKLTQKEALRNNGTSK